MDRLLREEGNYQQQYPQPSTSANGQSEGNSRPMRIQCSTWNINAKLNLQDFSHWLVPQLSKVQVDESGEEEPGDETADLLRENDPELGNGSTGVAGSADRLRANHQGNPYAGWTPPDLLAVGFQELLPLPAAFLGMQQADLILREREAAIKAVMEHHATEAMRNSNPFDDDDDPYARPSTGARPMTARRKASRNRLRMMTGNVNETFTCIAKIRHVGVALFVFCRDKTMLHTSRLSEDDVRTASTAFGFFNGYLGNKSAVGAQVRVKSAQLGGEDEIFTFVTAHLAPHDHGLEKRIEDYQSIVSRLVFTRPSTSEAAPATPTVEKDERQIYDTTHLFFFGDLNYRLSLEHPRTLTIPMLSRALSNYSGDVDDARTSPGPFAALLAHDTLLQVQKRRQNSTLHYLSEGDPSYFLPTYKYKVNGPPTEFKSFKKRIPGWTDRIFYLSAVNDALSDASGRQQVLKSKKSGNLRTKSMASKTDLRALAQTTSAVTIETYTSLQQYTVSDHKPVTAVFKIPPLRTSSHHAPPLPTASVHGITSRSNGVHAASEGVPLLARTSHGHSERKIVVLVSGSGTNLQAIIEACDREVIPNARIVLVFSNKKSAFGLERAQSAGIANQCLALKPYLAAAEGRTRTDYDVEIAKRIARYKPDIIVLAGFMHILSPEFLAFFSPPGKRHPSQARPEDGEWHDCPIINLHPALPGQFDGKDAIERAFEAFQAGQIDHTGVMIHLVVPEVDRGQPVLVKEVRIRDKDQLQDLEERIHRVEHSLIVEATRKLLDERTSTMLPVLANGTGPGLTRSSEAEPFRKVKVSAPFPIAPDWEQRKSLGEVLDRLVGYLWSFVIFAGFGNQLLGILNISVFLLFMLWFYRLFLIQSFFFMVVNPTKATSAALYAGAKRPVVALDSARIAYATNRKSAAIAASSTASMLSLASKASRSAASVAAVASRSAASVASVASAKALSISKSNAAVAAASSASSRASVSASLAASRASAAAFTASSRIAASIAASASRASSLASASSARLAEAAAAASSLASASSVRLAEAAAAATSRAELLSSLASSKASSASSYASAKASSLASVASARASESSLSVASLASVASEKAMQTSSYLSSLSSQASSRASVSAELASSRASQFAADAASRASASSESMSARMSTIASLASIRAAESISAASSRASVEASKLTAKSLASLSSIASRSASRLSAKAAEAARVTSLMESQALASAASQASKSAASAASLASASAASLASSVSKSASSMASVASKSMASVMSSQSSVAAASARSASIAASKSAKSVASAAQAMASNKLGKLAAQGPAAVQGGGQGWFKGLLGATTTTTIKVPVPTVGSLGQAKQWLYGVVGAKPTSSVAAPAKVTGMARRFLGLG